MEEQLEALSQILKHMFAPVFWSHRRRPTRVPANESSSLCAQRTRRMALKWLQAVWTARWRCGITRVGSSWASARGTTGRCAASSSPPVRQLAPASRSNAPCCCTPRHSSLNAYSIATAIFCACMHGSARASRPLTVLLRPGYAPTSANTYATNDALCHALSQTPAC